MENLTEQDTIRELERQIEIWKARYDRLQVQFLETDENLKLAIIQSDRDGFRLDYQHETIQKYASEVEELRERVKELTDKSQQENKDKRYIWPSRV